MEESEIDRKNPFLYITFWLNCLNKRRIVVRVPFSFLSVTYYFDLNSEVVVFSFTALLCILKYFCLAKLIKISPNKGLSLVLNGVSKICSRHIAVN